MQVPRFRSDQNRLCREHRTGGLSQSVGPDPVPLPCDKRPFCAVASAAETISQDAI